MHVLAQSPLPSADGTTTPEDVSLKRKLGGGISEDDASPYTNAAPDSFTKQTIARPLTFIPYPADPNFFSTPDIPTARNFCYAPAGLSTTDIPASNPDDPTSKPPPIYRTLESPPTAVRVSWEDRAQAIRASQDGLSLVGDRGFRTARLNVPIREGSWYFEVEITRGDGVEGKVGLEANHVRLGWGRREAPLDVPVGLDGYSYGMRDKTGQKVTLSRPKPYGRPFGRGDVVGLFISLPKRRMANPHDPHDPAKIERRRVPINWKGRGFFEMMEYQPSQEMVALARSHFPGAVGNASSAANRDSAPAAPTSPSKKSATVKNIANLPPGSRLSKLSKKKVESAPSMRPLPALPGSCIAFFVNGESQGVAFKDIYAYLPLRATNTGTAGKVRDYLKERENPFDDGSLGYYPCISLFGNATVRINPGPVFKYPPPDDMSAALGYSLPERQWRPLSERYPEYISEIRALDDKEENEILDAWYKQQQEVTVKREREQRRKEKKRAKEVEEEKERQRDDEEDEWGASNLCSMQSIPDPSFSTEANEKMVKQESKAPRAKKTPLVLPLYVSSSPRPQVQVRDPNSTNPYARYAPQTQPQQQSSSQAAAAAYLQSPKYIPDSPLTSYYARMNNESEADVTDQSPSPSVQSPASRASQSRSKIPSKLSHRHSNSNSSSPSLSGSRRASVAASAAPVIETPPLPPPPTVYPDQPVEENARAPAAYAPYDAEEPPATSKYLSIVTNPTPVPHRPPRQFMDYVEVTPPSRPYRTELIWQAWEPPSASRPTERQQHQSYPSQYPQATSLPGPTPTYPDEVQYNYMSSSREMNMDPYYGSTEAARPPGSHNRSFYPPQQNIEQDDDMEQ
jgi:COMPASS component BRE2